MLCQLEDACSSDRASCAPGSVCSPHPLTGHAVCNCPEGYEGANCSNDVDECSLGECLLIACKNLKLRSKYVFYVQFTNGKRISL